VSLPRLSAIVTTLNEAAHIRECLACLAFAGDVLVVDSFSTDGTPELAREAGAKVLQHEYLSPAAQRNWAIAQAAHEWVLMVDADERVSDELAGEIPAAIASPRYAGYLVKRRNFFLGREIRYSGWQNDWVLRLFRKDETSYQERQIHEQAQVGGPVGRLRGRLLHYSYRSMEDYWRKLRRYAEWNAVEASKRGERVSALRLMLHPPLRFLKAYVLRGGFLDGKAGLLVSRLSAVYAAAKDARMWEMEQRSRMKGQGP
jgi:glycosyltransferase involved in cell wall biosynthesis